MAGAGAGRTARQKQAGGKSGHISKDQVGQLRASGKALVHSRGVGGKGVASLARRGSGEVVSGWPAVVQAVKSGLGCHLPSRGRLRG